MIYCLNYCHHLSTSEKQKKQILKGKITLVCKTKFELVDDSFIAVSECYKYKPLLCIFVCFWLFNDQILCWLVVFVGKTTHFSKTAGLDSIWSNYIFKIVHPLMVSLIFLQLNEFLIRILLYVLAWIHSCQHIYVHSLCLSWMA
jgi:hypothetical protein